MDQLAQRFVVFAKQIRSQLAEITNVLQQQTKEITKANKRHQIEQRIPPEVSASVNLPQGIETHQRADQAREEKQYRLRTLWVQGLTLVAIVAYAVITYCLWHDTDSNFRISQQAWVGVANVNPVNLSANSYAFIGVIIRNTGKTPALKVRTKFVMEIQPKGTPPTLQYRTNWYESSSVVQPEQPEMLPVGMSTFINQPTADALRTGTADAFIYGKILYYDIFNTCHRTLFCLSVKPGEPPSPCATYNTTDDKECQ